MQPGPWAVDSLSGPGQSADIATSEWPQIHNLSDSYGDYGGDLWFGELDGVFNISGNQTLPPFVQWDDNGTNA